jgi:glycosyltransferase involved in cell wall biosynthesis
MAFVIGFDASSTLGPRRGPGRTALSLCRALLALEDADIDLRLMMIAQWRKPTAEHLCLAKDGARLLRIRRPRHSIARAWATGDGPRVESLIGGEAAVHFSPHGIPFPDGPIPCAVLVPSLQVPGTDPLHNAPWLTEREVPRWKRQLAQCPLILAPTMALCEELRAQVPDAADRIRHLPLGVDESTFFIENTRLVESTRQHWGVPASSFLLAVMGHGEWDRAQLLIDLYDELRKREPATPHLVVLGWKGRAPEVLRRRRDLYRCIHVLPHIPDAQLPALYSGAVTTILTGTSGGWPHALLEAQACGSPVVATDSAANREVAGESAILLDSNSAADWVEAVRGPAFHQEQHDLWKERGLINAARYRWEHTARALLRHLRGL